MWTLAFGHHEDHTPTHGYAATREAEPLRYDAPGAARCAQPRPAGVDSRRVGALCVEIGLVGHAKLGGSNSIADMALSRPMTAAPMFLCMSTTSRPPA